MDWNFVLVFLLHVAQEIQAFREFNVDGVRTILALQNEVITIPCKSDKPMKYCGFVHPSGERFSFSGPTLIDGHCSIKRKAALADAGEWLCHVGTEAVGLEMIKRIHVRVVDKVASIEPNKTVVHGSEATLVCTTTQHLVPISYCRFEPPFGVPFSIDAEVTSNNSILNKYYYPRNMSLDRGDCAVTIKKVKYKDVGQWTCGAGLDGKEFTDVINVRVEGLYTMSTASVTGVTFGAITIVIILALLGLFAWKKRHMLVGSTPQNQDGIEMESVSAPQRSPQRSPRTPQRSPRSGRVVPSVVIESPSDPGTSSPLVTGSD